MSPVVTDLLQIALLIACLLLAQHWLGDYMARMLQSRRHLAVERGVYRVLGVDPDGDQRWGTYLRSVIVFSVLGILVVYAVLRTQEWLPFSVGRDNMPAFQAFNTAVSFVTNTNWQSYSGEVLGYAAQAGALAVQNFLSAAVGIAVAVALIRGLARAQTDRLGSFWVDLTRIVVRILLPLSLVAAFLLVTLGVIQNFTGDTQITTLAGAQQTIPGGPVASQEAIKEIGTNGGGFFNANSSHPFENPGGLSNWLEIFLLLLIPFSLPRTFGRMVDDPRTGRAILAAMASIWALVTTGVIVAEMLHAGPAPQLAGAAMEGKEVRFGVPMSALFASSTTGTSTGSVNSMHDSFTAFGGGGAMTNILLGEVSPGGVGSGLYGMLILAIVTVFIAGLMVGRTPEFLGKSIGASEMKLVSLYVLVTPALVLTGVALSMATEAGRAGIFNPGAHGLSEVIYAWGSASNNNGSAFAGLGANSDWYNIGLAIAMALGRFLPIALVLALAGSLAQKRTVPQTAGSMPTHGPLFTVLLIGVTVIIAGLTYLPALALAPIAEGLS
ncbi:MAG: potassium-transporting ATPase subunit KdpA [Candidatus Nanopelagicales bacterium]